VGDTGDAPGGQGRGARRARRRARLTRARPGAQVAIPRPLARQMLGLAAADLALTWAWEHALRAALPAPRPPAKGFQAFPRELAALGLPGARAPGGAARLKAE
jgi:hypothetical protein